MTAAAHDVVMFEEAQALARRRRARIWLPVGIVVTILLALLSIAYYDYKTMRADALALSQGVIANLQSRIETEVAAYLKPIPQMIRLSVDVLTDQQLSDVQSQLIEPLGVATRQSSDVVAVEDPQISAAVRFIREHAVEGIRVDDVLRAVPMARTLLERRFRQCLNCSPHEHILKVRLDRVKVMLAATPLSLAAIAERTGFEHPEYLSVAFKRVVGLTPSQYRARHAT